MFPSITQIIHLLPPPLLVTVGSGGRPAAAPPWPPSPNIHLQNGWAQDQSIHDCFIAIAASQTHITTPNAAVEETESPVETAILEREPPECCLGEEAPSQSHKRKEEEEERWIWLCSNWWVVGRSQRAQRLPGVRVWVQWWWRRSTVDQYSTCPWYLLRRQQARQPQRR